EITLFAPLAGPTEWGLFAFQAIVAAAVVEELLCRGILLPWLLQRPAPSGPAPENKLPPAWRGVGVIVGSVALAAVTEGGGAVKAISERRWPEAFAGLAPALFIVAVVPIYVFLPRWRAAGRRLRVPSARAGRAIVASAMLFAAAHAAW